MTMPDHRVPNWNFYHDADEGISDGTLWWLHEQLTAAGAADGIVRYSFHGHEWLARKSDDTIMHTIPASAVRARDAEAVRRAVTGRASSDVIMLDANSIRIDNGTLTGTMRIRNARPSPCATHPNATRNAANTMCAECEREDAYRDHMIRLLTDGGMIIGMHPSNVIAQLAQNAPWPESEAASRVDHWADVAMQIGTMLAGLCTGWRTDGDHDADHDHGNECPSCGGEVSP